MLQPRLLRGRREHIKVDHPEIFAAIQSKFAGDVHPGLSPRSGLYDEFGGYLGYDIDETLQAAWKAAKQHLDAAEESLSRI